MGLKQIAPVLISPDQRQQDVCQKGDEKQWRNPYRELQPRNPQKRQAGQIKPNKQSARIACEKFPPPIPSEMTDKAAEQDALPPQLLKLYQQMQIDGLTPEDKQQAVRDYYAFCAYGDALIGEAVERFKAYSARAGREHLIIYTVGDHGWHLDHDR